MAQLFSTCPGSQNVNWYTQLEEIRFRYREKAFRWRRDGVASRLAGFRVDDPDVVLLGRETIYRDGERVGWLTSGGFGHSLGVGLGLGYVSAPAKGPATPRTLREGRYELEVATRRVAATIHFRPSFDPDAKRVRV